ncbi:MAG: helix-turn-helix domain-containing protein [Planctomycetota bacterium]|jgi:transcriptional regulator with XRE-family HTH domain
MAMTLGERVKKLMHELGMTQIDLARRSGVSQPMISKIISGERGADISTVEKIARALGTSPAWLLGEEEESPDLCRREFFGGMCRKVLRSRNAGQRHS